MFRAILLLALVGAGCGKDEVKAEGEKDWEVRYVSLYGNSEACPVWGGVAILKFDGEVVKDVEINCVSGGDLHMLKWDDAPNPDDPYYLCSKEITTITKSIVDENKLCVKAFNRKSNIEEFLKD